MAEVCESLSRQRLSRVCTANLSRLKLKVRCPQVHPAGDFLQGGDRGSVRASAKFARYAAPCPRSHHSFGEHLVAPGSLSAKVPRIQSQFFRPAMDECPTCRGTEPECTCHCPPGMFLSHGFSQLIICPCPQESSHVRILSFALSAGVEPASCEFGTRRAIRCTTRACVGEAGFEPASSEEHGFTGRWATRLPNSPLGRSTGIEPVPSGPQPGVQTTTP